MEYVTFEWNATYGALGRSRKSETAVYVAAPSAASVTSTRGDQSKLPSVPLCTTSRCHQGDIRSASRGVTEAAATRGREPPHCLSPPSPSLPPPSAIRSPPQRGARFKPRASVFCCLVSSEDGPAATRAASLLDAARPRHAQPAP